MIIQRFCARRNDVNDNERKTPMNIASKRISALTCGLALLIGLGACGSDDDGTAATTAGTEATDESTTGQSSGSGDTIAVDVSIPDVSIPDVSISDISIPDISIPDLSIPDLSIPGVSIPGFNTECLEYLQAISAGLSPTDAGSFEGIADAFDELRTKVPEDLQDDIDTLSEGFEAIEEIYAENDYDASAVGADPDAQALFTDEDLAEASDNVFAWLETECAVAG